MSIMYCYVCQKFPRLVPIYGGFAPACGCPPPQTFVSDGTLDREAESAWKRQRTGPTVSVEEWASRLASDLSKFTD